jgi:3-hydroxybutyrate dehydrogenase
MSVTNNHSTKKVAVVTGGANGIGAAISKTLVAKDYKLMIADTGNAFAEAIKATFFQVDLSEKSACKELIEATADQLGSVDVLFNNAGLQHISPLAEFPEDIWKSMINVMLNAPFLLTKYAWPHMKKINGAELSTWPLFTPLLHLLIKRLTSLPSMA